MDRNILKIMAFVIFLCGFIPYSAYAFRNPNLNQDTPPDMGKQVKEEHFHLRKNMKNVGLRSIQESSPFSPFPKDLSYPELTFNVVISFEVKP